MRNMCLDYYHVGGSNILATASSTASFLRDQLPLAVLQPAALRAQRQLLLAARLLQLMRAGGIAETALIEGTGRWGQLVAQAQMMRGRRWMKRSSTRQLKQAPQRPCLQLQLQRQQVADRNVPSAKIKTRKCEIQLLQTGCLARRLAWTTPRWVAAPMPRVPCLEGGGLPLPRAAAHCHRRYQAAPWAPCDQWFRPQQWPDSLVQAS